MSNAEAEPIIREEISVYVWYQDQLKPNARLKFTNPPWISNPEYNLKPKTNHFCYVCYQDIKGNGKYYYAMQDAIHIAIHPDDIGDLKVEKHAIGNNCAKKLGIEFTVAE